MRMMMGVYIPVEAGNAAIKSGSLAQTFQQFMDTAKPEAAYFVADGGERTAYMLVVLVVGTGVGALVGLFLSSIARGEVLAVIAGLAGTIVATLVRNGLVFGQIGVGSDERAIPGVVLLYAAVASLAGGLAGYDIALLYEEPLPFIIGGLAGMLSSILMGLLMITYHMHCDRSE